MFTPEELLEIAQYLQPKLHDLLPSDIAESIAQQLTALITKANNGESVAPQILTLLNQQPALQPYLKGEALSDILRIMPGTAGNMNAEAREPEYECPTCHKIYAELPNGRMPKCSDHETIQLMKITGA